MRFLQLVQQQAGISRRNAQAMIEAGLVKLNGDMVQTPFMELEPRKVKSLEVDGQVVRVQQVKPGIYKYYKPKGMLCSFKDPFHHYAMGKVLRRPELKGYQIVGRLDRDAEGLLLLTNDGTLLNHLAHPRYQIEKVYHVLVPKVLRFRSTFDAFRQMRSGLMNEGEKLQIVRGDVVRRTDSETTLVMVLTEGKNHEVKRLCRHFGWYVKRLKRVEVGGVELRGLKQGQLKRLMPDEIETLNSNVELALKNLPTDSTSSK